MVLFFLLFFFFLLNHVRVAQWIARLPPKEKAAGSNPASGIFWEEEEEEKKKKKKTKKKESRGDARIELATSCTRSKNHTIRPITLTLTVSTGMKSARGLVVMIVACQVMDPGSIPGERIFSRSCLSGDWSSGMILA